MARGGSGRTADDLRAEPRIVIDGQGPELPVNTAIEQLTQLQGDGLEITTRTSPALAKAAAVGYIYTHTFKSAYVRGRIEQTERLAISTQGQGRKDLIEAVKAGGRMPDSYITGGSGGNREYRDIWEE